MKYKRKKRKLITIIVIIVTIIILAGGYILYDKVLNPPKSDESIDDKGKIEETKGITEDEDYFNELLYIFLPANSASNFMKNIDTFKDEDITNYVFWYYENYANVNKLAKEDTTNARTIYNVNKKDIDELVLKVFGKKEYKIIETEGRTGVKKLNDNMYQVYWFASGWSAPIHKISEITNLEDEVIVNYAIMANEENVTEDYARKDLGTLKFHLTKNEDNWNVTKIEYIENK